MALNQNQKKLNISKIFTWIIAVVMVVSVFAGAISSFLLNPQDRSNASQINSSNRSIPIPANINSTQMNSSTKPIVPPPAN